LDPDGAVGLVALPAAAVVAVLLLALFLVALPAATAIAGLTGRLDSLPVGVPGWLAATLVSVKVLRLAPVLVAAALVRTDEDEE
jgi:hypothetical protein